MTLRPILRSLTIPVLGLALAGVVPTTALAEGAEKDKPAAAEKKVNVNEATPAELARLPRVGKSLADRIVAHRTQNGAFKRAEDLMEVKGIGEKMFATLKPYVSLSGPTTLVEKVSAARGTRSARGGKSGKEKPAAPPAAS